MCVYMHHIHIHAPPNTHVHHQIPPKYKIYIVGLHSVLYEIPGQNETSVLNQLFLLLFSAFHVLCTKSMQSANWGLGLSPSIIWKTTHMCAYIHHIHIHAPPNTHVHHQILPKYKIYLVGLPSVLYERPYQNERSVLISCFCCFSGVFQCFSWKVPLIMKTNKTRSICVYTYTIYTYMHHQISPKYKIYLVGLPSVLYARPSQNESAVFVAFHEKCHFSHKKHCFSWKPTKPGQYVCIHAPFTQYMHHMHHQIPPKYEIYLVGLPSVLYERPGQNERSVLNQLFLLLSGVFQCFSCAFDEKHHFSYQKCHFLWKLTKPGQNVYIHAPFTHTCTTKI